MMPDADSGSPMNRPAALDEFPARGFRPRLRIRPVVGRRPDGVFANRQKAERHIVPDDEPEVDDA